MKREIVKIDEELCNGCGLCIPSCHEGALQIIDGKVRLISELMCDGLGACLGNCPEGAITIEEREALPYNEVEVIKDMIPKGKNLIIAHLQHLKEHEEFEFLKQGVTYLEIHKNELNFDINEIKFKVHNKINEKMNDLNNPQEHSHSKCGCPGSKMIVFDEPENANENVNTAPIKSELRQWPIQMHLINPMAPYFREADVVFAADCIAFSLGDFHGKYLKGKSIAIACPKLDSDMEIYVDKLVSMIDEAKINTLTLMMMEVPCCGGILQMAKMALSKSTRKIPMKSIRVGLRGDILSEEWV
ncbi:MAG: 4Fe-4S ferredoxin [Bacteroidetes bacterium GWA2_30_7]|nr:MAG: 4Fe-4S ferredoxin [Bacteroidetes bacterium GWA2_30_7]